ncbi:MAG: uroporphyrinogen decarboxylase family protein, partial [Candidatus Methanomethyliaceae archaeon]
LLDYLTCYLAAFAQAQVAAGADVIVIADPTATGEILGPAHFRAFARPYLWRLAEAVKAAGAGVIIHICGNATPLLEEIREISPHACSFDSVVSIKKARAALRGLPSMGNISTRVLHRGSPETVARAAQRAREHGVSIIAPACGIDLQTPLVNLRALTNTVKGRPPL